MSAPGAVRLCHHCGAPNPPSALVTVCSSCSQPLEASTSAPAQEALLPPPPLPPLIGSEALPPPPEPLAPPSDVPTTPAHSGGLRLVAASLAAALVVALGLASVGRWLSMPLLKAQTQPAQQWAPGAAQAQTPSEVKYTFGERQEFDVVSRLDIASGTCQIRDLEAWVPAPQRTWLQEVVSIQGGMETGALGARAEWVTEPEHGNAIAHVALANAGPGRSDALVIKARIAVREVRAEPVEGVDPAVVDYDRNDQMVKLYLRPEPCVESDDPAIVARVHELVGEEQRVWRIARLCHDHVVQRLKYQSTQGRMRGARHACVEGWGEAGEYAALFVALCRAAGVPARPLVGRSGLTGPSEAWHCWAEFMLPGGAWVPVDTNASQGAPAGQPDWFGRMEAARCVLAVNYNLLLPPRPPTWLLPPEGRTGLLQTLTWGWHGVGTDLTCAQSIKFSRAG